MNFVFTAITDLLHPVQWFKLEMNHINIVHMGIIWRRCKPENELFVKSPCNESAMNLIPYADNIILPEELFKVCWKLYFTEMDQKLWMNLHSLFHTDSHLRNTMTYLTKWIAIYLWSTSFPLFINWTGLSLTWTSYLIYYHFVHEFK